SGISEQSYGRPTTPVSNTHRQVADSIVAANVFGRFRDIDSSSIKAPMKKDIRSERKVTDRKDDLSDTLTCRLKKQLKEGNYECMICCQIIRPTQRIWTCQKCYHMFHIGRGRASGCITKWAARSFVAKVGWRCPSCQNVSLDIPRDYYCFCGKVLNPPVQRSSVMPHSCNAVCGKSRGPGCIHPCNDKCHPGPCMECSFTYSTKCDCGEMPITAECGKTLNFKCSKVCRRMLKCGLHMCGVVCHEGECKACQRIIVRKCYCGDQERVLPCTAWNARTALFSCGAPCTGMYSCGVHKCELKCHDRNGQDNCGLCSLSPEKKEHCPCGQSRIVDLVKKRTSCTDPIPTCKNVCNKVLTCGPKDQPHRCAQLCHVGPCPPCSLNSSITCRCTSLKTSIPCQEFVLYSDENPYLCERRCKKMKSCQNHRCQTVCCIDQEHFCMQICGKKLRCGNHKCDRICHVGQCPQCLQASFEEQFCLCRRTVRQPPIPCGAALPPCSYPCSRQHPCNHPPMHTCHVEPKCPPCTVLTQKPCYGGHEIRSNIPCYLNNVSCGRPCGKELPCGVHQCKRICHAQSCLVSGTLCQQMCTKRRVGQACDHICGSPCHGKAPCPKTIVIVTCPCFRKSENKPCYDVEKALIKALSLKVEERCWDRSVTYEEKELHKSPSIDKYCCLDRLSCDDECKRIIRNKKLEMALNISTTSTITYSSFLKNEAKLNCKEVLEIEHVLIKLINDLNAQQNAVSVSHAFRPMNSELRRVVHEYCRYFKIETLSQGQDPRRNVIATAKRNVSEMPVVLLMSATEQTLASRTKTVVATTSKEIPPDSKDSSCTGES
ncbi:unnamed protein product, partial [Thelazia callipaeda]|uniref:R3H domain-containing protein n=1 Tax=Thelazia callipaeda TaxID=103827 RepID=A0A0N5D096_THECL